MMTALRDLQIKRLVVAALFVPFLLFAFFSSSLMPRFTAHGIEIVICTGTGFATVTLNGDHDKDRPDDGRHSTCDWSMQIHVAALPVVDTVPHYLAFADSNARMPEFALDVPQTPATARFARAPPLYL